MPFTFSKVIRIAFEKINGKYQGACYPFKEGFQSGTLRARWGNDGSMFVGQTSRGWGATGKDLFGLQRLVWNGRTPFEMKTISARPDGFEVEFTQPVNKATAENLSYYELKSFIYKYQHQYGSPIINQEDTPLRGVIVSEDRMKVRLVINNIRQGYIHQVMASGLLNDEGQPLLHDIAYYTLNEIPTGDLAKIAFLTIQPTKEVKVITKKEKVIANKDYVVSTKEANALLKKHACLACHNEATKVVGPSYTDIAKRNYTNEQILELVYKPQPSNWPEYATEMAPMSHVPKEDVLKIAAWINSLGGKKAKVE